MGLQMDFLPMVPRGGTMGLHPFSSPPPPSPSSPFSDLQLWGEGGGGVTVL